MSGLAANRPETQGGRGTYTSPGSLGMAPHVLPAPARLVNCRTHHLCANHTDGS
jgi:hypothetical protein